MQLKKIHPPLVASILVVLFFLLSCVIYAQFWSSYNTKYYEPEWTEVMISHNGTRLSSAKGGTFYWAQFSGVYKRTPATTYDRNGRSPSGRTYSFWVKYWNVSCPHLIGLDDECVGKEAVSITEPIISFEETYIIIHIDEMPTLNCSLKLAEKIIEYRYLQEEYNRFRYYSPFKTYYYLGDFNAVLDFYDRRIDIWKGLQYMGD